MRISTQMKSQVFACLRKVFGIRVLTFLLCCIPHWLGWIGGQAGGEAQISVLRLLQSLNMGLSPCCWSLISELCPRLCYQIPLWVSAAPSVSWASLSSSQERDYSAKNSLFSKVGLFVTLFCEIRLSPCSS